LPLMNEDLRQLVVENLYCGRSHMALGGGAMCDTCDLILSAEPAHFLSLTPSPPTPKSGTPRSGGGAGSAGASAPRSPRRRAARGCRGRGGSRRRCGPSRVAGASARRVRARRDWGARNRCVLSSSHGASA
jgi:hypothetical protein